MITSLTSFYQSYKNLRKCSDHLHCFISDAELSHALFMLEICAHSNSRSRQDYYWQPHWHGLIPRSEVDRARKSAKVFFPWTTFAALPFDFRDYDDDPALLAYMSKFSSTRKIHDFSIEGRSPVIHEDDLTQSQRVELMCMLDQLGLAQILQQKSTCKVKLEDGTFVLCPKGKLPNSK